MKKRKRSIIVASVMSIAFLLIGYGVYNAVFPFARPLEYPNDYPSVEDVLEVTISTSDGKSTDVYWFAPLIMQIQQARPTRKMSVNDFPAVDFYYKVELITKDNDYYYFIYENNKRVYLEIPYYGIYTGMYHSGGDSLMEIIPNLILNHCVK